MQISSTLALGLSLLLFASCKSTPPPRGPANAPNPPTEQGESWTGADEDIARQIVEETRALAFENRRPGEPLRRDAHPKHHGCVQAFFTAENSTLPENRRFGVLGATSPQPAWLRLSNGDSKGFANPDSKADVRGFALKIMNAADTPAGSHDIIAISSPRFFARDSEDYLQLFHALRGGFIKMTWYMARNPTNALIVKKARIVPDNPLSVNYFVPVPTKFGAENMRMHFRPCANESARQRHPDKSRPDYLREGLTEALRGHGACFDLLVQVNRDDPSRNPVEDPTRQWSTDSSPWQLAGRVEIPAQTGFDTPARMAFCENLSFNPWNAPPDLRPMGQINRARRLVYDEISRLRHHENQVPQIEPRDHRACEGDTAPLCR